MKVVFVRARGQNAFFDELASAIVDELQQLGVQASTAVGEFPAADEETVYVLAPPHEYFALTPREAQPTPAHLARTIFICAEQPGSAFWETNAKLIAEHGCPAFDINAHSATALTQATGHKVDHFQLGWTRSWTQADPASEAPEWFSIERDIDLLYMGTRTARRDRALALAARSIHNRNCRLILGDNSAPLTEHNPEWLGRDAKWEAMARSKLLLNIHRDDEPYFEWLRVVQAICNGCAVLSERSVGDRPLVAGEHYFATTAESIGVTADCLLEDPDRLHAAAKNAFEFLREELPLARSAELICDAAEGLLGAVSSPLPAVPALPGATGAGRAQKPKFDGALRAIDRSRVDPLTALEANLGQALREQKLEMRQLRGEIRHLHHAIETGGKLERVRRVYASAAYEQARPTVSVITPLFNYERLIEGALTSAAASSQRGIELVVVDDGSGDDSLKRARGWMQAHASIPSLLLSHPVNRGLGYARNTAVQAARGRYVFALDADNTVYPRGIEKLVAALDHARNADFAWGYLETHDDAGKSLGILSGYDWEPERFADGNYIDAMVLLRRDRLLERGGYTTSSALYGWEDYELFLRIAEAGGHGVLVPEFVARYRTGGVSMAATTNLAEVAMLRKLVEMYPATMNGEQVA